MTAAQAAHLRLLSTLPVRTHERSARSAISNCGGQPPKQVGVGHCTYESVTDAARQLGYSRGKVRNMIERGEARYL